LVRISRTFIALALVSLIAVAFAAVACDDEAADSESSASQESIDEVTARVQYNEMMVYWLTIGDAGLHDMDEGLNDTGVIESEYIPNTRKAIRLFAVTDWPEDMQADADAVEATAVELLHALEDDDAEAAAPLATELHDGWHDFDAGVQTELFGDLPPDAGGVEEHEDEGTPAADETPEEDHDEEEPAETATP
jgi:hypothetical protein